MEFATGALGTLLPKLAQLLEDEYNLHKGVKNNIVFLTRELKSVHAALRDVGEVPPEQLSEVVKVWAREAREVSYDMEDIVDTFLVRVQGTDRPTKKSRKRFIKEMMGFFTKAKIRHDIGQEIKDIKERVELVARRRDRYKIDVTTPAKTSVDPRIAALYNKVADLVGIDGACKELIMMLTKDDDKSAQQRKVSVVGFGGLGKTTLAKAVYEKLKGQFDCTGFVPVGRNPDLKKVFKAILVDLGMHINFETWHERQLIDKLREFLEYKRYFIVIDDVWDTQSWDIIKLAFIENNRASRIITTTRNHEVAGKAGEVYKLQPLSDDYSRKLFFARKFGGESKSSNQQPDGDVSNKILRKCGGIPLAIITMASLLVGKPMDEWSEVRRSIGFANKKNQQAENTEKILSFSYYDLPSHLRTCLLYLCVFPEDYFIEKSTIVWMWIAEGFVREKQGMSSFEIGEGYFNELVNRSMIQMVEECEANDMVYGCYLHDMVLDLLRSISSEENFLTILDNNGLGVSSQGRVQRLSLQNNHRTVDPHMSMEQARSFISCGCDIDKGVPLSSFKLICVLAIDTSQIIRRCHLEHLRNLHHLRYLRLWCFSVDLPEELGTLKFLKTLDVKSFNVATTLGLLTQLLCLRFRRPVMLNWVGKLTSLEELEIYFQGEKEPWKRFVKDLGSLRKLRVLHIGLPHHLTDDTVVQIDTMVESLSNLEKMEHLHLSPTSCQHSICPANADTAMWEAAGFVLPRHLRRLFIRWISFSRFPSFCINPSHLPNLYYLSLYVDDIHDRDLRILGGLPELRFLDLSVTEATEVACHPNTSNDATEDGYLLFQKLRRCCLWYSEVRFLPIKDDFGSISFRVSGVHASMILGSEWKDVCDGKAVAPTLIPSVQELRFTVFVQEFKDGNDGDCGSFALEYFASLQNISVQIYCDGAYAAEVEEVEAALRRAASVHPNRPTIEVMKSSWRKIMNSAAQDQEVQRQAFQREIEQQHRQEEDIEGRHHRWWCA